MRTTISIALIIVLLSCTSQNSNDKYVKKHLSDIENQIKRDSTKGEDFNSFFEQFKKDSIFQKNRISLPFQRTYTVMIGPGGIKDSTIVGETKEDWIQCSFKLNDSLKYPIQHITIRQDTSNVQLEESDSGYSKKIYARFIRIKGKWFNNSLTTGI